METKNDSIHATIERATRRLGFYTPDQRLTTVRAAKVSKQPYRVKEMTPKDFVDFKSKANSVKNLTTSDTDRKLCGAEPGSLSLRERIPMQSS